MLITIGAAIATNGLSTIGPGLIVTPRGSAKIAGGSTAIVTGWKRTGTGAGTIELIGTTTGSI